jgi:hypothetical protein
MVAPSMGRVQQRRTFAPRSSGFEVSAPLIVTMDMPSFISRRHSRAHRIDRFERKLFDCVGIGPIHETPLGTKQDRDAAGGERWLAKPSPLGCSGH